MKLSLFPKHEDTIAGAAEDIRAGHQRCIDLVERCLSRIDECESEIRAWVSVDREGAREQARRLDGELQKSGPRGPLHGVPIAIKDIVDVEGWPTACGSKLLAQTVAKSDATLVKKLRDAGAIILGKTVTTQFACFDPPPTRNPWHFDRTPGGSSSGSAAALATGMCFGAIGSQTGGSITRPASFCGIAGCKPTFGRVSTHGVYPVSPSLDHPGPMARTVRDLAIMLDAIAGYDPLDANSLNEQLPSVFEALNKASEKPPILGRLGGMFHDRAHPQIQGALERAIQAWSTAGEQVFNIHFGNGGFDDLLPKHRTIMVAEMAARQWDRLEKHPDDYLPVVRGLLEDGKRVGPTEYEARLRELNHARDAIRSSFVGPFNAVICPAALGPAPDPSTTGDSAFNAPWSYLGVPTVSFPIGLSSDGLPLGVQLVGRHHGEVELFRVAQWCEDSIRPTLQA